MTDLHLDIARRIDDAWTHASDADKARTLEELEALDGDTPALELLDAIRSGQRPCTLEQYFAVCRGLRQDASWLGPPTREPDTPMNKLLNTLSFAHHRATPEQRESLINALSAIAKKLHSSGALMVVLAIGVSASLVTSAGAWRAHQRAEQAEAFASQAIEHLIEAGHTASNYGEHASAPRTLLRAIEVAEARASVDPDSTTKQLQLALAVQRMALHRYRTDGHQAAQPFYERYAAITEAVCDRDCAPGLTRAEFGYGQEGLGIIALEAGDAQAALGHLRTAEQLLLESLNHTNAVRLADVENTRAWQSDALFALGQLEPALALRQRQLEHRRDSAVDFKTLRATAMIARLELALGRPAAARDTIDQILADGDEAIDQAQAAGDADMDLFRQYLALIRLRARANLALDRPAAAFLYARYGQTSEALALNGRTRRVADREIVRFTLTRAEIALAADASVAAAQDAQSVIDVLTRAPADIHTPQAIARAYEILGEARLDLGQSELARQAFRAGLDALPDAGHALNRPIEARLAYRLGFVEQAQQARAATPPGFADTIDVTFWQGIDPNLASTPSPDGDDDG